METAGIHVPDVVFQVDAAKQTLTKIESEETGLNETLSNIKDARPFEELTVSCENVANPSEAGSV